MQQAHFDAALFAALHLSDDASHQSGTTGDGFEVLVLDKELHIQVPPV